MRKRINIKTLRKTKGQAGFTLIELIIAFSTASIVFLAAATILVFGQRSLSRTWQQANLQREASLTTLKIKQSIRGATSAVLDEDENGVTIYHAAGWIRFWFLQGQKDLLYQLQDEEEQTLLDGVVEQANFDVDESKVTVGLELDDGDCQTQISSTTVMRNYASGS
jgi:type II secretory pathway pseudopilin PulG